MGLGKATRPPVTEMTCKSPRLLRPSANRKTAGVEAASRARGLRCGMDGGRLLMIVEGSMLRMGHEVEVTEGRFEVQLLL
jgi:hypothetical protein